MSGGERDSEMELLAAVARDEEARADEDGRWAAYARGEASPPTTELGMGESYAEHMRGAVAPRSAEDDERLVAAALRARAVAPSVVVSGAPSVVASGISGHAAARASSRPRRVLRVAPWALPALAAAAGAVLLVRSRGAEPALPPYTSTLEGATEATRGELESPVRGAKKEIAVTGWLRLVARPSEPVSGALEARAFATCGGAPVVVAKAPVVSSSGAARLEGRPRDLLPGVVGACRLTLVVGRPGAVPGALDEVSRADHVRVVHEDIVVRADLP